MTDKTQIIDVMSFEQLEDRVDFVIEIERPGDVVLRVPVRELTYGEWVQVELDHPMPKAPIGGYLSGGQPWYDTNDTNYREQRIRITEMWMYRRLLKALKFGVPGDTVEEQVANIEKRMPAGAVQTLIAELQRLHGIKQSEVKRLADNFQPVPDTGSADL